MQTLVLGTPASQEPLESFFQRLGNEAVNVIGSDGAIRARIEPTVDAEAWASEAAVRSNPNFQRLESEFLKDLDELKRRAARPMSSVTTDELLKRLNSLPLPS